MKLVTFATSEMKERLGIVVDTKTYDLAECASRTGRDLPTDMLGLLQAGESALDTVREVESDIKAGKAGDPVNSPSLLAPVPHPPSCRDAYAFRQHVAAARRNRGVEMIPEFDQYPIFYFTNHNAISGPGDIVLEPDHWHKLDFELEVAAVIGRRGRNVDASDADNYIAGYTIMNDLSARRLQMEEMKLNLGPAKGKDFSTVIGPWLVTTDELASKRIETPHGNQYNLRMTAKHNSDLVSDGNMKDMTWTFAEIIERCSYGVDIFPGDVIGSGTVGTGCYLELNGTRTREARDRGETYEPVWLKPNDLIELEIEDLGTLTNRMVESGNTTSILAKKKDV